MALFKKKKEKLTPQQEALKHLVEYHTKNGDWYNAFYFSHKGEIDLYDHQIVDARVQARKTKDKSLRVQKLYECKALVESFRKWCEAQKNGAEYYAKHDKIGTDKSYYQMLLDEIEKAER